MTPLPPVRLRTGYAHKMKTGGIKGQAKQLSALVLVEGLGRAASILPFVPGVPVSYVITDGDSWFLSMPVFGV